MPPKKRQRKKRPHEKMQEFLEIYQATCKLYDVPTIATICDLYDDLISKKSRKMPQLIQFAEETVEPTHLRPLVDSFQKSEVRFRFLSMLNTNSGDEGLHVLAHALVPPLEIAGLAYHANNVGPSGCRALGRAMVNSKTLAVLELDFNPGVGDEGVEGLANYGHCPTLNKLSLRFCDIGDRGAAALGRWIADENCRIKEILLNGNKINPPGAVSLAEGLAKNNSIVRLDLADNLFGFDGGCLQALHDGIKACPTIQCINMMNHFECPEGMAEKFLELTQTKPLGECVLTVKMDTITFQNTRQAALANKKKLAKEAKQKRKKAKTGETGTTAEAPVPGNLPVLRDPPAELPAQTGLTDTGTSPV